MNVQHLPLQLNDLSQRPEVVLNLLERYSRATQQSVRLFSICFQIQSKKKTNGCRF